MKKIAVFGKPGSGKSTFSKILSASTGIALYQLDSIVYKSNGEFVDRETFDEKHKKILSSDNWILDGLGPISAFTERLKAADTLIYLNLPYPVSYWLVTKRLLKGLFVKPEGWPDESSVIKGTIASYKALKMSPKFWNNDFEHRLKTEYSDKSVHIIRSIKELDSFIEEAGSKC
ncbi:adenylate kinase [Pseudidiomarina aestuarii]|uniref:Adenylate kinase n=1 Tax=Pseudidiomarina aestuarii TaxID=624146 RepID=A0A7Z7EUN6_9GAMM|nr:adenylate kinase [Pseudidiomarina aestuarii]RUO41994.1 adenylate kinase [Pseudidiomarina aestuarii]